MLTRSERQRSDPGTKTFRSLLPFKSHWLIFGEKRNWLACSCFSSDTRVAAALQSCLRQCLCVLHAGPHADDFSPRVWPASTSLSLNKYLISFLTWAQNDNVTLWLIKSMLSGDAPQKAMSKSTCSWCLLAYISLEFKLFALKGKCSRLLYTFWFQPPKPLLEINLNHGTSALKPKPKPIILMASVTNTLFLKFCCE